MNELLSKIEGNSKEGKDKETITLILAKSKCWLCQGFKSTEISW